MCAEIKWWIDGGCTAIKRWNDGRCMQIFWLMDMYQYGQVMRRKDGCVLYGILKFEVDGQRRKGRPKNMEIAVGGLCMKVEMKKEDALSQHRSIVGINQIASRLRNTMRNT